MKKTKVAVIGSGRISAFRDHGRGMEVDIYTIPADGAEEKRLTCDAGFNDGPEYSPGGRHIWFISTRFPDTGA